MQELELKYGCNPNQKPSKIFMKNGKELPIEVLNGNPLPSFEGEPKWISIPDDMNAFADALWNSLNEENKVSLFVRYIDIATGEYETKIINKNM